RNQWTIKQGSERANANVFSDRPEREDSVALTVPGDQRDRIGHFEPGKSTGCRGKHREQQLSLAMTGESGQPNNLALMGNQFDAVAPGLGTGSNTNRGSPARRGVFLRRS